MKRLVFNVFYHKDKVMKAPNIHSNVLSPYDVYLRNSYVSLCSAKANDQCEVAIVTNEPLENPYNELFEKAGITNIVVPFDTYIMPSNFKWGYAFYKLCALKHLSEEFEYDAFLLLDTDTIVVHPLLELWEELNDNSLLLYNLRRKKEHSVRCMIELTYAQLYSVRRSIIQWGGNSFVEQKNPYSSYVRK